MRDLEGEIPKNVVLIERDFTIESGELTPTLKVKRRAVEKNYKQLIERGGVRGRRIPRLRSRGERWACYVVCALKGGCAPERVAPECQ